MSSDIKTNDPQVATVIDEAHMEQFTNDQLAYKAWIGTDLAQEILFDDESEEPDLMHEAKFEVAHACMALRVLVRRLTGMDADTLRQAVLQRQLAALVLCPDVDQFPVAEALQ